LETAYDKHSVSIIEQDRRAFRKKQTAKSVLISCASLIAIAVIVYIVLSRSDGWEMVKKTYFSWPNFVNALPKVLKGLWLNVKVLIFSVIGVSIIATAVAYIRTTRSPVLFPLRVLAVAYTSLFRGVPLLIVLYLVGFGIPALGFFGRIPAEILGTIAVTIVYAAYVAEVIRAGIESVHPSQRLAARSLGFSHGKTMRIIIIPQAVRNVIPALMNDFVAMQKDVGLVSVVGAVDAVRSASIINATTFNYTPYICAGVLFIAMSLPFILLTDWYSKKVRSKQQLQGAV